jgi:hypothetical protein
MAQTKQQKAVVRRWVKALESGLYKQGENYLVSPGKNSDKFCCLGVLCDMAVRDKVIPAPGLVDPAMTGSDIPCYAYNGSNQTLPKKVMAYAGVSEECGKFIGQYGLTISLAELNDGGKSFKQIAKIIKSNPEGLFV